MKTFWMIGGLSEAGEYDETRDRKRTEDSVVTFNKVYPSYEAAKEEAHKQAVKRPGVRYVVLQATGSFISDNSTFANAE